MVGWFRIHVQECSALKSVVLRLVRISFDCLFYMMFYF